jgi:hypothetical protein
VFAGRMMTGGDSIVGIFGQGDQRFPLTLRRAAPELVILERPQEPVPPYPYRTQEVRIYSSLPTAYLDHLLAASVRTAAATTAATSR